MSGLHATVRRPVWSTWADLWLVQFRNLTAAVAAVAAKPINLASSA